MKIKTITEMDGISGITTGVLLLFGIGLVAINDMAITNSEAYLYALLAISLAIAVRGVWNTWKGQQSNSQPTN